MFKNESEGIISYSNRELAKLINMPVSTISRCNRSLEEIGNISNKVPARITAAKLKIIVLDDEKNFVLRI